MPRPEHGADAPDDRDSPTPGSPPRNPTPHFPPKVPPPVPGEPTKKDPDDKEPPIQKAPERGLWSAAAAISFVQGGLTGSHGDGSASSHSVR